AFDVRNKNCYGIGERNITPYGQVVTNNKLPQIFSTLATTSGYKKRRQEIASFNATSQTHLKGLAMTAVKFGISFTTKFLNQGNALVNVYTDGTIQVSTGGTEMGQGLNTKISQIVADVFGISTDAVLLMPTSTEKNNNTSPTAASAGTDLNGRAASNAALQIRNRMAGFAAQIFSSPEDGIDPSPEYIEFGNGQVWDRRLPDRRISF
ncbi:MAG: molybdopterin-dependent oxidoreductase, partial [Ottowia sp.]|nr:molybdopterin-dependent oxidoreductase [Ottowia sp.]